MPLAEPTPCTHHRMKLNVPGGNLSENRNGGLGPPTERSIMLRLLPNLQLITTVLVGRPQVPLAELTPCTHHRMKLNVPGGPLGSTVALYVTLYLKDCPRREAR